MDIYFGQFLISDNKELLNIETVKSFLARSYWANKRPEEIIEKSISNSYCIGIYRERSQVGFARIITDDATTYWLCDVFIDEDYRGHGLGKKLLETITNSDRFKNMMGILGTKDAHGLYEQYYFEKDNERFMRRMPDFIRNM
ncbi:GNAT family N-acetyltransferase [Paenibacillus silvae]|uniref:N-acetyltransferase n=1 Tax=Paenibacillus silvae TaxID=1325358 RepID=A0A2W6NFG5_9BACL|nr:GNAT family N-acetyltransferase [Paenibacillus silvae]PZT54712.1 N-acetyltransferase [Paenibacillus silvae]